MFCAALLKTVERIVWRCSRQFPSFIVGRFTIPHAKWLRGINNLLTEKHSLLLQLEASQYLVKMREKRNCRHTPFFFLFT
jgi:hypothetical protein